MSTHLDGMIANARAQSAREIDDVWNLDRQDRVRAGALRRRDGRVRRERVLRRGLLVAGGAALLVLALLRGAASAPAEPSLTAATSSFSPTTPATAPSSTPSPGAEALAARSMSDAGYARD
ncbi:MAG: hypothetical protein NVS3B10_27280 [Polyangiales bacterium]